MLAHIRQHDRQPPPEELIQDRRIIQEARQEIKPDYQQLHQRNQELSAEVLRLKEIVEQAPTTRKPELFSLRDRVLKSLTIGRGRIATTSPQYKTAIKALDKFIDELS